MSDVDRLSNSGVFPALPIADRRSGKDDQARRHRSDRPDDPASKSADTPDTSAGPPPPKSRIDVYA